MKQAYFFHILSLLLFGSIGVVASHIALSSYEIVLCRCVIGGLTLLSVFLAKRQKPTFFRDKRQLCFLLLSGAAMGCSWMFLYEAYARLGVGVATLAYYSGPVLVMLLAPLVLKETLTGTKLTGFAAVVAGMVLLSVQGAGGGGDVWGLCCGVLSAVMYAIMVLCNKKAPDVTGLENTLCQLWVSFVVVGAFTAVTHKGGLTFPLESLPYILFLGVVSSGAGCYWYFSSFRKLPAQTVSVLGYLEPLSAVAFSAVFLGERLTGLQWAGAACILGGAAFAELYHRRDKGT